MKPNGTQVCSKYIVCAYILLCCLMFSLPACQTPEMAIENDPTVTHQPSTPTTIAGTQTLSLTTENIDVNNDVTPIPITPATALFLLDTVRLLHPATALAFSPDGSLFAVGTLDEGVYIYQTIDFTILNQLPVQGIVRGISFASDSKQLAILAWVNKDSDTTENTTLSVWEPASVTPVDQINLTLGSLNTEGPQDMDLFPGILQTIEGDQNGYLVVDVHTSRMDQEKMIRLDPALNIIYQVTFPLFASSSCPAILVDQGQVLVGGRYYDLESGNLLNAIPLFENRITCMTANGDSLAFAALGDDFVRFAKTEKEQLKTTLNLIGASDEVLSLTFNQESTLLAASTRNNQLFLWNVENGELLRVLNGTYHAVFSPDGTILAVIHSDLQLGAIAPWSVRIYQVPVIPENFQQPESTPEEILADLTPTPETNREATAVPTIVASYFACSDAMPSNLVSNMRALISSNVLGVRVRTSPGIDQPLITSFSPNDQISIMDGPICADGYVWWLIQRSTDQIQGWAAEGGDQIYWIIPCSPEVCP